MVSLLKRGVDVTVIHDVTCLMNRQLDSEAAHLLQKQLENNGMKFRMGVVTKEIVAKDAEHLSHLTFREGEDLVTDLVIMAVVPLQPIVLALLRV